MTTDTTAASTDDAPLTRGEIVEAINSYNATAKRQPHHRDCATWNNAHARIDELLTAAGW